MRHLSSLHPSEAYLTALREVWNNPDFYCAPRGLKIREVMDYSFTILQPDAEAIITHDIERNLVIADYTQKEMALYNSCSNKVEDFAKASKFWKQLANPDGTINSAYGYLIWKNKSCGAPWYEGAQYTSEQVQANPKIMDELFRTPWSWCVESLKRDKDTRQAVMKFSLPDHHYFGVKDFTCTLHGNWLIRDDRLYLSIVMRSGDLLKGAAYDWPFFMSLMDKMVEELKPTYPELTKGTYTHQTHSFHIYEKDEATILKMLGDVV
jgi:thymidylate synthase